MIKKFKLYLHAIIKKLILPILFFNYLGQVYSQKTSHPLSFDNANYYNSKYPKYFYKIKKEQNQYKLTDYKGRFIFHESFDTIVKNNYFIKTVLKNNINLYRIKTLEKIEIPNLKQVYFLGDGLDVLTSKGAMLLNNEIKEKEIFSMGNLFKCGCVYKEKYKIIYNEKTKKHIIEIKISDCGTLLKKYILELNNLPNKIEDLCFLNNKKYCSESVNDDYPTYPHYIKVKKGKKTMLYNYNEKKAVFIQKKPKINYIKDAQGNIIGQIEEIEDFEEYLTKKGTVEVKKVLPLKYDDIQQDTFNGLIYLYKDNKIGIYPNHIKTDFTLFYKKTNSFYEIIKNGRKGWLDIISFKEYYFDK